MAECVRVLRPGGILAVAYISRFFILQHIALADARYRTPAFIDKLLTDGALAAKDPDCFWTDTYFATPQEMEALPASHGLVRLDHFAADGMSPVFAPQVDGLDADAFAAWCALHERLCREPSLLGGSNHGMVIAGKPLAL